MAENYKIKTYAVKDGDTLWALSRKFETTVDKLKELNGIGDSNIIKPGQGLIVSKTSIGQQAEAEPQNKPENLKPQVQEQAAALGQALYINTESQANKGVCFLTFDDGPVKGRTDKVLDALKGTDHKATFFVIGERIKGNEDLLKRMVDEGHEIAVHTWTHKSFNKSTTEEIQDESKRCAEAIFNVTGVYPEFSRPPGGNQSTRAKEALAELGSGGVIGVNDKAGFNAVFWDVDTNDWNSKVSDQKILDEIKNETKDGSIILAHDLKPRTCALVPDIVTLLDNEGFTSKKLSDSENLDGKVLNPMTTIGSNAITMENRSNGLDKVTETASRDAELSR